MHNTVHCITEYRDQRTINGVVFMPVFIDMRYFFFSFMVAWWYLGRSLSALEVAPDPQMWGQSNLHSSHTICRAHDLWHRVKWSERYYDHEKQSLMKCLRNLHSFLGRRVVWEGMKSGLCISMLCDPLMHVHPPKHHGVRRRKNVISWRKPSYRRFLDRLQKMIGFLSNLTTKEDSDLAFAIISEQHSFNH